jgi:hypothetical protein
MNSADKIKKLFKDAELSINSDADEKIFQDVFEARQKAKEKTPAQPVNIWRLIMKNSLTKFAAAAVLLIACMAGLTMINTTSNVALADVLEHIKQAKAFFYQSDASNVIEMMGTEMNQDIHTMVWISQDYGMRMDMEMEMSSPNDPNRQTNSAQSYLLPEQNEIITIMPSQKQYIRVELDAKQTLEARQEVNDPNLMVEQILECKYISLGKSTVDGIEVEGFQTTDPNYGGGMYRSGQVDIKLWVDVKTQLPVKIEEDIQLDDQMNTHSITYDFQWDIPVDAAIFEPVIPDDYTSFTTEPIQVGLDENAVMKGLKLLADMTGKYPEKLDLAELLSLLKEFMETIPETPEDTEALSPFLKQIKEESEGLSREEIMQKGKDLGLDLTMSVMGLQAFHAQLVQEDKDPAYYGDIITPDDAGQVLMRWKVSDNEYRVIFGSLYAETVTADVLAELEKNLPK